MIRKYFESFVVVRYYPFVALCPVALFPALYLYMKDPTPGRRLLLAAAGIVVGILLVKYRYDRYRLGKQLKALPDVSQYEDGILLGRCILSGDSFLYFDGKTVAEHPYAVLKEAEYHPVKGKHLLALTGEDREYTAEAGSEAQAQRVFAFLKDRNPGIILTGTEPSGDGRLHSIY